MHAMMKDIQNELNKLRINGMEEEDLLNLMGHDGINHRSLQQLHMGEDMSQENKNILHRNRGIVKTEAWLLP